jgi:radical SAM superfamily enzyme YgiQ (UPF0313 family)
MRVALVGAELEENLGLRYMASALEGGGHEADIVAFNAPSDAPQVVDRILRASPGIVGLSMVFTSRAREFCELAQTLRDRGYDGRVIAGGHFACLNATKLLEDFPAFDCVGLGEGEELICALADRPDGAADIPGLCYRTEQGAIAANPSRGNPDDLDALAFPRRTTFHEYFGRPIASILSSRGCWRNCAFCSINAWYKQGGGKRFRIRSVDNIVAEMKELYFDHGVRIFNFQDDNFFLPTRDKAVARFEALRDGLRREGVDGIAIAVKARPDSISREAIAVLDDLGLFRVFLGVENASEDALRHLNRQCELRQILDALEILNDFDVHLAFNILMFEPDTVLEDIRTNLRFIQRHVENPFNFCRAEAYAGTGLEETLLAEDRLLGDYFGFDYRLKDPRSEAFHQIANYAFFDRNFNDFGLHYFNMQVDFYFQLLRRFEPELLTEALRARVRNFIKLTNLDTYERLSEIFDWVAGADPKDQTAIRAFAGEMREKVDARSTELHADGERLLRWITASHEQRQPLPASALAPGSQPAESPWAAWAAIPYRGLETLEQPVPVMPDDGWLAALGLLDPASTRPIPYDEFKRQLEQEKLSAETPARA